MINCQIFKSSLLFIGSKTYSDWFDIDRESGVVTTQSYLDCELEGSPKVIVVATDKVFFTGLVYRYLIEGDTESATQINS